MHTITEMLASERHRRARIRQADRYDQVGLEPDAQDYEDEAEFNEAMLEYISKDQVWKAERVADQQRLATLVGGQRLQAWSAKDILRREG